MKYDPNCIHYRDDYTCGCRCDECSKHCPFYDTDERLLTALEKDDDMVAQGQQDYQESGFAAGVEHQKKRAIKAAKIIINRFYESQYDPTIDYLKLFTENL